MFLSRITKRIIPRVIIMIMAVVMLSSCGKSDIEKIYEQTEGNVLLIGGWVTPRAPFVTTQAEADKRYKELADAGITMMYTFGGDTESDERLTYILNAAHKNGIGMMVSLNIDDPNGSMEIVKKTKDHPAVIGYNMKDEPPAYYFDELGKLKDRIYEEVGDSKIIMINLLPNYASDDQLAAGIKKGMTTYQYYVERCMEEVRPTLLCTDFYPFGADKNNDLNTFNGLLNNLSDLRNGGAKYGVDVWGFLQNSGWGGMREPNFNELRYSAHLNLAFGVKCLAYFLCWNPHEGSVKGDGTYDPTSMISYDGKITANYSLVKKVNKELHAMKGIFLDYDNKKIILHNAYDTFKYNDLSDLVADSFNELTNVTSKGSFVIGCFEKEGNTGLYVVSADTEKTHSITLKLSDKREYRIWGAGGLEKISSGESITISMTPGTGKFIELSKTEG